jgi:hypothetical protein
MFDTFRKRIEESSELGPQAQEGQQILDRALALGALSVATARTRAELDVRRDSCWDELVSCGYLREGQRAHYYLAHPNGSADRMFGAWTPTRVVTVAVLAIAFIVVILRRLGG